MKKIISFALLFSSCFGLPKDKICDVSSFEPTCDGEVLSVCIDGFVSKQTCGAGTTCDPIKGICAFCGDGEVSNVEGQLEEECDFFSDPNCNNLCLTPICGDGILDSDEACDDGNILDGDGCEADCSLSCGNGVRDLGEDCDDGNNVNNDGCDADCVNSAVVSLGQGGSKAGSDHSCALTRTGDVRCWGQNDFGQLGYGNTQNIGDNETPASAGNVNVGGKVAQIDVGGGHTCALLESGRVRCWGAGSGGRLGYGNNNDIGDNETPASAGDIDLGPGRVVQLAAATAATCALFDDGKVRCWGQNFAGQLGEGNTQDRGDNTGEVPPPDLNIGGSVKQLAAGDHFFCALLTTGNVRCWGFGGPHLGVLRADNIGDNPGEMPPADVNVGGTVAKLTAGNGQVCALLINNAVRCWGSGDFGQLGYGNVNSIGDDETPASAGDVNVGAGTIVQLSAGISFTCAVFLDGNVRCWGGSGDGSLGNGVNTNSFGDQPGEMPPSNINIGSQVTQMVSGFFHNCALLESGAVRCWGLGAAGRLGYGNTNNIGDNEVPAVAGDVPIF